MEESVFDPTFGDTMPLYNVGDESVFTGGTSGDSSSLLSSLGSILSGGSGTMAQLASLGGIGALLNSIGGSSGSGYKGYQGSIPKYTAQRTMNPIPTTMVNAAGQTVPRRPGSGGISYFSPMVYTPQAAPAAAPVAAEPVPATQPNPTIVEQYAAGGMAQGGLGSLGSYSDGGRLLKGPGDGVSDSIPAMIGKNQPARLADGEFVIPARIVSEIGNGSTDAGARKLYAMMDRIQKARGKTLKNVAANTKADKHLPA
jgi:hypothetical protein